MTRARAPASPPPPPSSAREVDGITLRARVQELVRAMGFLASDRTPCGKPLAVSQAHALMVLRGWARTGGAPGQRMLGEVLGIDKSNVARLCQRMVQAGQLRQLRSAQDGRIRLLSLTPKGARLAEAVERSSRERFAGILAAVAPAHRPALLSALAVLNSAIRATTPSPRGRRGARAARGAP